MKELHDMTIKQSDRIAAQLINANIFNAVLTGGEPLDNKRVLFNLLQKLKEGSVTVSINSNLIPLKPVDAERLKALKVDGVLTSLLGPDADTHDAITQKPGSFERTVDGIRLLREIGVRINVNMVISKVNLHLLGDTAKFVKGLGVKGFFSTRAACPGNCHDFSSLALTLEEFRAYLAEFHELGTNLGLHIGVLESYPLCGMKEIGIYPEFTGRKCLAGVTSITIAADGSVRPCSHLDIEYGNILSEELQDVWVRMEDWRIGTFLPENCRSCKLLSKCGGGCRMEAKMINGALNADDPYASPKDIPYVLSVHTATRKNKRERRKLPPAIRLNPKVKWREESFGSIVFVGQHSTPYLNHDATDFLKMLIKKRSCKVSDLLVEYGEEARGFLQNLYDNKVLISV